MDRPVITEREVAELIVKVDRMQTDICELKEIMKGEYQTKERAKEIEKDVAQIQGGLSKVVLLVISIVITELIYFLINKG